MPVFEKLQRASFAGIEFPIRSAKMKCIYRHHEHVYLKTPGAATEKMSRGLYIVDMAAEFDVNVKGYKDLWPGGLSRLRRHFEQGTTAPLVIPTVGSIPAFMPQWDQEMDSRIQSGEKVALNFKEDNNVAFLENALSKVSATSFASASVTAQFAAQAITPRPDIFDQIQAVANDVFGAIDQAELRGNLLAAKIEGLTALIREADRRVEQLQDPANFQVVYALQDLLAAALELTRDITQQQGDALIFVVPMTMSVGQLSIAIYNDTKHFEDIVANNRIEDPFAVPAGTPIIYFRGGILNAA